MQGSWSKDGMCSVECTPVMTAFCSQLEKLLVCWAREGAAAAQGISLSGQWGKSRKVLEEGELLLLLCTAGLKSCSLHSIPNLIFFLNSITSKRPGENLHSLRWHSTISIHDDPYIVEQGPRSTHNQGTEAAGHGAGLVSSSA